MCTKAQFEEFRVKKEVLPGSALVPGPRPWQGGQRPREEFTCHFVDKVTGQVCLRTCMIDPRAIPPGTRRTCGQHGAQPHPGWVCGCCTSRAGSRARLKYMFPILYERELARARLSHARWRRAHPVQYRRASRRAQLRRQAKPDYHFRHAIIQRASRQRLQRWHESDGRHFHEMVYFLTSPQNRLYIVVGGNLARACRCLGLNPSCIHDVVARRSLTHQGWKATRARRSLTEQERDLAYKQAQEFGWRVG